MLDFRAVERGADFRQQGIALVALDAVQSHLDQTVSFQATVDFGQHRGREPFLTDGDDGVQMVRGGAEGTAMVGSQWIHHGILA